jgi:hypothetical protein
MRAKFIYESIKHLKPRSEEELKPYYDLYKDWEPDGYLTLNNFGGIEIKIIDNEGIEYRYNFGDEEKFKPISDADIEYGYDENEVESGDEKPDLKPYFMIGDDKYFLDHFMRIDR